MRKENVKAKGAENGDQRHEVEVDSIAEKKPRERRRDEAAEKARKKRTGGAEQGFNQVAMDLNIGAFAGGWLRADEHELILFGRRRLF